jgi:hypothetical protein
VLGRILLTPSRWRLEAMGGERLSRLRSQFEQHMGDRVRFSGERVDDLGIRMSAAEATVNQSLCPPRLLENPSKFLFASSRLPASPPGVSPKDAESEWMRAAEREFLDNNVPAFSNRTPREAANDPLLRPKLVQLMKQRVRLHDERNLETGRSDDINWLLRELNLTEIIFDPPPWRPPPTPLADVDAHLPEQPVHGGSSGVDLNRPSPPPLPDRPFEMDEAIDRLQEGLDLFKTAAEAEKELAASGATILEDAGQLVMEHLTEEEFCITIPSLLQAWFAFVPRGCLAPQIDFDDFESIFESNLRQIENCVGAASSKKLESFFVRGVQPGLMLALVGGFLEAANTAPKAVRPSLAAHPVILALLKSVVEILDKTLRPN